MRKTVVVLVLTLAAVSLAAHTGRSVASASAADGPQFTADGKLVRPANYRRWIYVSSGFGMSYTQKADDMQMFTNVFVKPAACDYYLANGKWPDKTMFVLEIYGSTSQGSINKHGSYQKDFMGLDVEVKDETRFGDKWAYFNFERRRKRRGRNHTRTKCLLEMPRTERRGGAFLRAVLSRAAEGRARKKNDQANRAPGQLARGRSRRDS